jgi:hypothetical protein
LRQHSERILSPSRLPVSLGRIAGKAQSSRGAIGYLAPDHFSLRTKGIPDVELEQAMRGVTAAKK